MSRLFIFGITAALATACTADTVFDQYAGSEDRAIIMGEATGDELYRSVGGIFTNRGSICTGTLITPTTILTAAHCVEPMMLNQAAEQSGADTSTPLEYRFTFSRDMRSRDPNLEYIATVDYHEAFPNISILDLATTGPKQWEDIALMYLDRPVTDRAPVKLVSAETAGIMTKGRRTEVVGYGMTDDINPMSAGTLHHGVSTLDEVGVYELLAGTTDEQQACRGDSGGPIFIKEGNELIQVGVASRLNASLFPPPSEPPPCNGGLLYTRVDAYADWLEDRVDDTDVVAPPVAPPTDDEQGEGDSGVSPEMPPGGEQGQGGIVADDSKEEGGCALGSADTNSSSAWFLGLFLSVLLARRIRNKGQPSQGTDLSGSL